MNHQELERSFISLRKHFVDIKVYIKEHFNKDGLLRAGVSSELTIPAEEVAAHLVSPALLSLNDEGIIGIKILTDKNTVKFISADIVLSSDDGVYLAGLPYISTVITVGQGYVRSGMQVNPVTETDTSIILSAQSKTQGK